MKKFLLIILLFGAFNSYVFNSYIMGNVFSTTVDTNFVRQEEGTNIKEQAFFQASKRAFKNILYKVVLLIDADNIDYIVNNNDVNKYIYGFNISNEDVGRDFYNARISFTFNQNLIIDLLREQSVRFISQDIDKSYLTVPFFTTNGILTENQEWDNVFMQNNEDTLSNLVYYDFDVYSNLSSKAIKNLFSQSQVKDVFLLQLDNTNGSRSLKITSIAKNKIIYDANNIQDLADAFFKAVIAIEGDERKAIAINDTNKSSMTYYLKVEFNNYNEYVKITETLAKNKIATNILATEFANKYVNIEISTSENLTLLELTLKANCINLQNKTMTLTIINSCNAKT